MTMQSKTMILYKFQSRKGRAVKRQPKDQAIMRSVLGCLSLVVALLSSEVAYSHDSSEGNAPPIVIESLSPGTYVLTVTSDGTFRLELAVIVSTEGTTIPPPTTPTGSVRDVSAAEFDKIDEAVSDAHRAELADKFRALAFAIHKGLISVDDAATAEMAIIRDEVGGDYDSFIAWQTAYRAAINSTQPKSAGELATQYENVASGLTPPAAIDLDKLLKIIMFILELIRTFKGL